MALRNPRVVFMLFLLCGTALRWTALKQLDWFFGDTLHVDEITYSQGDSPPFERPPGMYLLASISRNPDRMRMIFSLISLVPSIAFFLLREPGMKNSLLAGVLAVEPTLAFSGLQVLPSAPAAALLSIALCLNSGKYALSGWITGMAALFRGELLLFLPLSILFLRPLRKWAWTVAGFTGAVLPLMVLNLFSGGTFSIGENGPLNLWLGTSWELLSTPPGLEYEELVRGDDFTERAMDAIGDSPVKWLGIGLVKSAAFLSVPGPGRNIEAPELLGSSVLMITLPLTGILLALGIGGAGRNMETSLLAAGIASAFIFFPSMRHRAVYIPALVLMASSLRWKPAVPAGAAVLALSLFMEYPAGVRRGMTEIQMAQNRLEAGRYHDAIRYLELGWERGYRGADYHSIKGASIASSGGEFAEAAEEFSRALELAPESPTAWKNMAALLWNYGYREDAVFAAERAVYLNPLLRRELASVLSTGPSF